MNRRPSVGPRALFDYVTERSLALPAGTIAALLWANTASASYFRFAHALEFAVNDIGMVFFFALAAKEVVEATAPGGALHTWRRAALPCFGAVGGMAAPALLFIAYAYATGDSRIIRGWAIPCATDIAFSYLVAKAIFRRHPAIPFLLLLAIVDDALGLVVLAVFYPAGPLHATVATIGLAAAMAIAFALRRRRIRIFWPYVIGGGTVSWAALYWGGLHPALALVPVMPFLPHAARDPGLFVQAPASARDALSEFEHWWRYPVQAVLFLFGLVNAGVRIGQIGNATWAVFVSILAGKPIGIVAAVAIATAAGFTLPQRMGWRDLIVVGAAAGIGFTVALFFATAAFPPGAVLDESKLGALFSASSALVAVMLAAVLRVGRFTVSPARRP
jgi:Na+:H+ antiporter, NhaA family